MPKHSIRKGYISSTKNNMSILARNPWMVSDMFRRKNLSTLFVSMSCKAVGLFFLLFRTSDGKILFNLWQERTLREEFVHREIDPSTIVRQKGGNFYHFFRSFGKRDKDRHIGLRFQGYDTNDRYFLARN